MPEVGLKSAERSDWAVLDCVAVRVRGGWRVEGGGGRGEGALVWQGWMVGGGGGGGGGGAVWAVHTGVTGYVGGRGGRGKGKGGAGFLGVLWLRPSSRWGGGEGEAVKRPASWGVRCGREQSESEDTGGRAAGGGRRAGRAGSVLRERRGGVGGGLLEAPAPAQHPASPAPAPAPVVAAQRSAAQRSAAQHFTALSRPLFPLAGLRLLENRLSLRPCLCCTQRVGSSSPRRASIRPVLHPGWLNACAFGNQETAPQA
ncbi:hypothetical protein BDZ91DRAFT_759957 [Kalaharituber pfeilii]|nr:hypothetical protein BDZ91DRAFT_759957 [Kalaharituber pfeilii]